MDIPVYEGALHIVRTDPPESIYFVTFTRWDDREGGAVRAPKVTTAAELRRFLRAAQAHVDDIDEALTAFETRGVGAYWIPRGVLTGAQIDALGL